MSLLLSRYGELIAEFNLSTCIWHPPPDEVTPFEFYHDLWRHIYSSLESWAPGQSYFVFLYLAYSCFSVANV